MRKSENIARLASKGWEASPLVLENKLCHFFDVRQSNRRKFYPFLSANITFLVINTSICPYKDTVILKHFSCGANKYLNFTSNTNIMRFLQKLKLHTKLCPFSGKFIRETTNCATLLEIIPCPLKFLDIYLVISHSHLQSRRKVIIR